MEMGLMSNNLTHYVYYSYEELGRGYIGSRTCKCDPQDDSYFGSYTDKTFKPIKKIILAICESKQQRYELEYMYQKIYNVVENPHFVNKSFQTTTGFSRLGLPNSPESRKKMSESRRNRPSGMKGKKHSDETKKRIANSLKGVLCPSRAVKWTEERRKNHSKRLKGKKGKRHDQETIERIRGKLSKKVIIKSLKTGEIREFKSQVEAAKNLGCAQGAVNTLCTKKSKRLYEWVLCDENGRQFFEDVSLEIRGKSVKLMNVKTKEIAEYSSVKAAANAIGSCPSTISKIIRGRELLGHVKAPDLIS
jgi:group I intron endonuclease